MAKKSQLLLIDLGSYKNLSSRATRQEMRQEKERTESTKRAWQSPSWIWLQKKWRCFIAQQNKTKLRLAGNKNKIRRYVNKTETQNVLQRYRVPKPVHKRTVFLKKDISIIMRMMRRTIQFYPWNSKYAFRFRQEDWSRIFMRSLIPYQRLRSMWYVTSSITWEQLFCLGHACDMAFEGTPRLRWVLV
jgi:hypothetical protein